MKEQQEKEVFKMKVLEEFTDLDYKELPVKVINDKEELEQFLEEL